MKLATSQSGAEVKSLWSCTSTPPYASMKEINGGKRYYCPFFFHFISMSGLGRFAVMLHVRAFVRGPLAPFLNPYPEAF